MEIVHVGGLTIIVPVEVVAQGRQAVQDFVDSKVAAAKGAAAAGQQEDE